MSKAQKWELDVDGLVESFEVSVKNEMTFSVL
jgi:hypothetical protein